MERSALKFVAEEDGGTDWAYFAEYPDRTGKGKAVWLGPYRDRTCHLGLNTTLKRKRNRYKKGVDYSSATVCDREGLERIHTVMPAWLLCPWLTKKDMLNQLDIKES